MFKTFATAAATAIAAAALAAGPVQARTEMVTIHGTALEGNLEGNAVDRQAYVFLPPSYDSQPKKRYPVVYFLHGYFATPKMYEDLVKFQDAVDEAAAKGNELIVVLPDGHTKFKGAMYGASPTTGDFPAYIARDVVSFVDGHFRTLAQPASRGLSGHSMGGYGTLRIAMTHPGIFSSVFAMAPCCLSPSNTTLENLAKAQALTPDAIATGAFGDLAQAAMLAAWAPDPKNAPHFIMQVTDEAGLALVNARLHANSLLAVLPQHLSALKAYEAVHVEVGDKDFLLKDDTAMHEALDRYGVTHSWEVFDGDHGNRVNPRFRSHLLPFFGQHLDR